MLRQGDWKFIAYPGYEPQLFNIKEDPEEMHDRAGSLPEIRDRMDRSLKDSVDYEAADAEAKAYDRMEFSRWREELGEAAFRRTMVEIYPGWREEHFRLLDSWLGRNI